MQFKVMNFFVEVYELLMKLLFLLNVWGFQEWRLPLPADDSFTIVLHFYAKLFDFSEALFKGVWGFLLDGILITIVVMVPLYPPEPFHFLLNIFDLACSFVVKVFKLGCLAFSFFVFGSQNFVLCLQFTIFNEYNIVLACFLLELDDVFTEFFVEHS